MKILLLILGALGLLSPLFAVLMDRPYSGEGMLGGLLCLTAAAVLDRLDILISKLDGTRQSEQEEIEPARKPVAPVVPEKRLHEDPDLDKYLKEKARRGL